MMDSDTAENEQQFAEILPIGRRVAGRVRAPGGRVVAIFLAKFRSFSAVSALIFASKYASFCVLLDLRD